MVTLPNRTTHHIALGLPSVHVAANPVRRGPVVLATDGSSESGAPVVAAELLAARLDLPLEVISVLEPSLSFTPGPDLVLPIDASVDEARRDARETAVRDYVSRFAGGAAPAHVQVRVGNVATQIARFAHETSATIVVMGSAPHRRFRHAVSGERAAQLLHAAPCPVLSVPPTFTALPTTVVAAVDFGPSSVRAAEAALLVVGDGGTVLLTHVVPRPIRIAALNIVSESELAINIHALFDILREQIASSIPDGVNVETRLVADDTLDGILSSATQADAQLIAVGTHGPGPVARLFLGSVADAVLRNAEQAVLASPPPRPGEARVQVARDAADPPGEHEWAAALDAFSQRNAGRTVTLQIQDPTIGAHITGHGYTFLGATYEAASHRVEIMVGDSDRATQHLTRTVLYPDAITITPTTTGDGEVLDIRHGQGHTMAVVSGDRAEA